MRNNYYLKTFYVDYLSYYKDTPIWLWTLHRNIFWLWFIKIIHVENTLCFLYSYVMKLFLRFYCSFDEISKTLHNAFVCANLTSIFSVYIIYSFWVGLVFSLISNRVSRKLEVLWNILHHFFPCIRCIKVKYRRNLPHESARRLYRLLIASNTKSKVFL